MTINDSYTNTADFSSTTDSSVILETTTFAIKSTNRNESLMNSKDGMTFNSFFFNILLFVMIEIQFPCKSEFSFLDSVPIISIALPVAIFITVGSVVLILGILWYV